MSAAEPLNTVGHYVAVSPDFVIARLRISERALLPREIAPLASPANVVRVADILRRLRREGVVRFNEQTDRWSLVDKGVPHETKTAQQRSAR